MANTEARPPGGTYERTSLVQEVAQKAQTVFEVLGSPTGDAFHRVSAPPVDKAVLKTGDSGDMQEKGQVQQNNLLAEGKGTWYHAGYHLVCIIAGAGTLAYPSTMAYLGWGPGMVAWVLITIAAFYCSVIISTVVDDVSKRDGFRYFRYRDICVREYGRVGGLIAIVPWQFLNVVGISIALMIGAGQALQGIQTSFAYYNQPGQDSDSFDPYAFFDDGNYYTNSQGQTSADNYNHATAHPVPLWGYIILSCVVWWFTALIPSFHELRFLSLLALCCSIVFSTIIIGLSFKQGQLKLQAAEDQGLSAKEWQDQNTARQLYDPDTFSNDIDATVLQQVFGAAVGLATIAFAFGNCILPEVMGGVREPAKKNMVKAYGLEFAVVVPLYFLVTISGYWAFGFTVNSFVLAQFSPSLRGQPQYVPLWTLVLANLAVFLQALPSCQVYCQVLYDVFDPYVCNSSLSTWHFRNVAGRLFVRTLYIAIIAFISCLLPFFANFLGLIGSLSVVPAVYVVPCILHLSVSKPGLRNITLYLDWIVIIMFTMLGGIGAAGSLWAIQQSARQFKVFTSNPVGTGAALG